MEENSNNTNENIVLNEKSMEILIAKFIPTSQYFESRFDHLQYQVNEIKDDIKQMQQNMDRKFEQVDKRFVDMQTSIDKRFEQVDKRFEQINEKLDKVLERIDVKIDRGLAENRSMTIKLFSFAMLFSAISMAGILGKIAGIF